MTNEAIRILLGVASFQAKHLVFDFLLQTPYQLKNKGTYGHPGGVLHAGLQAVGTLLAVIVLAPSPPIGAAIVASDLLLHYHIDWLHNRIDKRLKLTPDKPGFYYSLGVDQLTHQATYLLFLAVLMTSN